VITGNHYTIRYDVVYTRCISIVDCSQNSTNRDELAEKFADASTLKSDIDRRGQTISALFASSLAADEFADFKRLMAEKTRVRLQRQELEDWSRLADQQLNELSVDSDDSVQDTISRC